MSLQSGFRRWAGVCRGVSAGAQPNSKLWAPQHSLRAPSPSGPSFLAACGRGRRATGRGSLLCDREGSSSWSGPGSGIWLGRRTGLIMGSGHRSLLPAGVDHTRCWGGVLRPTVWRCLWARQSPPSCGEVVQSSFQGVRFMGRCAVLGYVGESRRRRCSLGITPGDCQPAVAGSPWSCADVVGAETSTGRDLGTDTQASLP